MECVKGLSVGFWKLCDRLRVEGHHWNHKRMHRVYCALRLNLPRRTTRPVPRRIRQPLSAPPVLNQTWALDFMTETLSDSRRVRLLTMIDEGNREGLEIGMGVSLPSRRVIRILDERVAVHGVAIHYIQPGKPDQNAYIDRFNRSYRTEVPERASLRIDRGVTGAHGHLVANLQQRAAS